MDERRKPWPLQNTIPSKTSRFVLIGKRSKKPRSSPRVAPLPSAALLAHQIELLAGDDEGYERAQQQAVTLLDQEFHLGGKNSANRDKLHERQGLQ
jgi:hypothetical protein